ncbi:MAG: ABC transporter ATP-binding protein, partial [Saprospiraceae bacterium]
MLLGITHPTAGSFSWFDGVDNDAARQRIGTLLETPNFYPYMTAEQNLDVVAHIKKVKNVDYDALLEQVNLAHRKKSKFKTYSLGMKQRLAIAAALVGDPDVLIFDEPTNGLDPRGIAEVREIIQRIAEQGKTIIMASHILVEVEKICSHVAILQRGKLMAAGTVGTILTSDKIVEVQSEDLEQLANAMQSVKGLKSITKEEGHLILTLDEHGDSATDINCYCFENGIVLTRLVERKRSLESEFLEITSRSN